MFRTKLVFLALLSLVTCVHGDEAQKNPGIGTWRQVAVVIDGKDIPVVTTNLAIITDEGYSITLNGQPYRKGTSKADRTKNPVESDVTITEGDSVGVTLRQISKIEGNVMLQCIGAERPKEFKSVPGSGHTLIVWIRVK
jgi:uncharacterized protein (TIGR03067 family)